ncbi:MAG: homocysteine S-methyltransferase family protein [Anaerolineae bacterium]|nr:homocysteine S-methyltransferase family protein [Anaerolineae bacterium]
MQELSRVLESGHTLIADGATGTMIQSMGLSVGSPPELWNAEQPANVRKLYRAYLDAGSQIILTNTFGGSRLKLDRAGGFGARTVEFNRAAAGLARLEADGKAYVAGDIGPTGELMEPYGTLGYDEAVKVFAEQARALVEGGVDLLWVETMSDLSEAQAAVTAVKSVCDLPVFCSLSYTKSGRTMMGVKPSQAAETLWPLGLAAIGMNCGEGIEIVPPVLTEYRQALPGAALIAKPNAGLPRLVDGQTVFDLGSDAFAEHAPKWVALGARIVGGCCGSSPQHIAAIAAVLR